MGLRRVSGGLGTALLAALLTTGLAAAVLPATVTSADVRATAPAAVSRPPLAGKIVGIDPGHNGLNYTSPAFLARKVWNGREWGGCDTTGTQTLAVSTNSVPHTQPASALNSTFRRPK